MRARLEEILDAEPDDEEAEFLEEALDYLIFNEDMGHFDMFSIEPDETDE